MTGNTQLVSGPLDSVADMVGDAIRQVVPEMIENALAPMRATQLGFVGQRDVDLSIERLATRITEAMHAHVAQQFDLYSRGQPHLPTRDELFERIDNAITAALQQTLHAGPLFRWRGEYSGEQSYKRLDIARHKGAAWIAFGKILGEPGKEGQGWELLVHDGEQGANGPRGATGKRGPAGERGEQGEPGQAAEPVIHCGLYEPERTYAPNSVVAHNGQAWWCIAETNQPPPGPDWRQAVKRGERGRRGTAGPPGMSFNLAGNYDPEAEYLPGDVVRHGPASWAARRATQGIDPVIDDAGPWQLLCRDGG